MNVLHPRSPKRTTTEGRGPKRVADAPVIELCDVSKVYRTGALEVAALRDANLRVERNELVAIMGPSGSGKSTLMHILGCLDVPSSGVYRLAGHDVQQLGDDQLADVRNHFIGFVFQQFNLLGYLPAWRNVELPLVYSGVAPAQRRERALAALAEVDLADRAEHTPGELSGGQQQRVAIARALVTAPTVILADEPTGNLDSVATKDVLALLESLHAAGRTIVLITHEADVAARAHRTVHITDGRVYADDSVLALSSLGIGGVS
jgi:putative ABC transport system ATP-binding protein